MGSSLKLDFDFRRIVFPDAPPSAALCAQYAGTLPYAAGVNLSSPNPLLTLVESPHSQVLRYLSHLL